VPRFPIVDGHVHLWDSGRYRVPWLDGEPALAGVFELAEYRAQTAGIEIEAFVYVEVDIAAEYKYLEVRQAERYAAEEPRLKGIVASAPLEYGEQVRPFLEALAAVGPRVKGVRRLLQGESDPAFCLRPGFVRGVELLAEYGFSFDICVKHHQLAAVVELVRRCPGTPFVLDHIGKPAIAAGLLDPWREHVAALGSLPNVDCKVSGMVNEADPAAWTPADLAPYLIHVLTAFGEDRVLFSSDWPVVTAITTYAHWVETLDGLTADLSEAARRKLWAENAKRVYRLG
jgi:L-fuconolactonase